MADDAGESAPPRRRFALLRGRRGVTTVAFALALTALLGALGLGTEAALWYEDWVQVQGVADAAALSGAISISVTAEQPNGGPAATMTYVANQNGYVNNTNGVTITTHYPPADGSYANNSYAAEITINKQEALHVARLFMSTGPTVTGKAVGLYKSNSPACVTTLGNDTSSTNNGQLNLSGGTTSGIYATGCTIAANGTGSNAIDISPSPTVSAYTVQSAGGINWNCSTGGSPGCGTNFNLTRPYSSDSVASTDPLASVQSVPLPATSGTSSPFNNTSCTPIPFPNWNSEPVEPPGNYCSVSISGASQLTLTFNGGVGNYVIGSSSFTAGTNAISIGGSSSMNIEATSTENNYYINGGINISGAATLNVGPGTYFINNGSLFVGNGGSLTCTACVAGGAGVTFVLMGSSPGTVTVSGAAPMTFSAPASSNYNSGFDGVAIYEPPSNTGTNYFEGSGTLNLQGAVYTPGAMLNISGSAGTSSATCSWFIANTITISGSGYATDSDCASYGYSWGSSKGTIALVQ